MTKVKLKPGMKVEWCGNEYYVKALSEDHVYLVSILTRLLLALSYLFQKNWIVTIPYNEIMTERPEPDLVPVCSPWEDEDD